MKRLQACWWVMMASYGLLLVMLSLGQFWHLPANRAPNTVIWLIVIVPLLAFLPGLLRRQFRTFIWLCFVLLLYFLQLTLVLWGPQADWVDAVAMAALVSLYVSAMLCARWQAQAMRAAQAAAQDSTGPQ